MASIIYSQYEPKINAMEALELGPNGGLVYCIEFLEKNMDWLEGRLAEFPEHYFVFDCPGQAELYTHHSSFANIVKRLMKPKLLRLAAVHLVDVHHCADAGKFFPAVLLSLSTMISPPASSTRRPYSSRSST